MWMLNIKWIFITEVGRYNMEVLPRMEKQSSRISLGLMPSRLHYSAKLSLGPGPQPWDAGTLPAVAPTAQPEGRRKWGLRVVQLWTSSSGEVETACQGVQVPQLWRTSELNIIKALNSTPERGYHAEKQSWIGLSGDYRIAHSNSDPLIYINRFWIPEKTFPLPFKVGSLMAEAASVERVSRPGSAPVVHAEQRALLMRTVHKPPPGTLHQPLIVMHFK